MQTEELYMQADALALDYDPGFDDLALAARVADGLCDGLGTLISSRVGVGYLPCSGCNACDSEVIS